jgi:hypothetical protein
MTALLPDSRPISQQRRWSLADTTKRAPIVGSNRQSLCDVEATFAFA